MAAPKSDINSLIDQLATKSGLSPDDLRGLIQQSQSLATRSAGNRKKTCFVISPIGAEGSDVRSHADDVFNHIIKPALSELGFAKIERSDHMSDAGRITEQMFAQIAEADLCIAVLTGFNPNVFYELAVAQCAARPVIILIEKGNELPFDVKDIRSIEYALQPVSDVIGGKYKTRIQNQIGFFEDSGWSVPSLFDEYEFGPKFKREQQLKRLIATAKPKPLSASGRYARYRIPTGVTNKNSTRSKKNSSTGTDDKAISFVTGDIKSFVNKISADILVSLVDTHLELSRYHDGSVSGTLRYLDASKTRGLRITKDNLRDQVNNIIASKKLKLPVRPTAVVPTPTSELKKKGVKYVFHVAATEGSPGAGYQMRNETLDGCIRNVFVQLKSLKEFGTHKSPSIAFPMLGASASDLDINDVAHRLISAIINEMQDSVCKEVFVIAWLESHRFAIDQAANDLNLKKYR